MKWRHKRRQQRVGDAENRLASFIGARVLRVLNLEPLHPLQLRDAHPAVLRLPVEVGRTADPMLPGQLAECDSGFAFLQYRNDLLLGKTPHPHDIPRTGRVYYLPVSEPGEPTTTIRQHHYRETNLPKRR